MRLHKDAVLQTENVVQMKNVYNLANVFVHRHSFWTQAMEANVKTRANDMLAELTRNALLPIHHNVCAKLDLKEIRCRAASMKMVCNSIYLLMKLFIIFI